MTEYYAICENKVIEEPTNWNSITSKISKLGLKLNGNKVAELSIPDNVQSVIQCKYATIVCGKTSSKLHIIGFVDCNNIIHTYTFNFNTGQKVDFSTEHLNLIPHSIKQ
jgi:hypothetical protein